MSNPSVGQIDLDLLLNSKQFQNQVKNIVKQANSSSNKISGAFKKIGAAVAAAFSVAVVVNFGKECVKLGSDLQEVQNVVDVTFTSMSEKVNKFAKDAMTTSGLSETMAKKFTGTYGAMSKSFGFSEKQAYDMSTALTTLAGDVASFYNLSHDEAYTKLKSVFTGETETLKDLGVVMTQTALDSYAMANGFGKTTKSMTEAEKVSLRYAFVQDKLSAASGDFLKTQDSWANQTRLLQLRFESLKATLGQAFIQVLTPLIRMLNTLMEKLQQAAEMFASFVNSLTGGESNPAGSAASAIAEATSGMDGASENVSDNLSSASKSAKEIKNNLASFDKLNVLDTSSDDTSGTSTTPSAGVSTVPVKAELDTSNTAKSLQSKFKKVFKDLYKKSGAENFVKEIQKGIKSVDWSAIKKNCTNIFNKLKPIAKTAFDGMLKVGKAAFGTLGSVVGGSIKIVGKSLQTITGGISKWLEKDKKKIQGYINTITKNFEAGFNNLSLFFDNIFSVIGDSLDRMRPQMESAIANLLSGFTTLRGTIGIIFSESFAIATEKLNTWVTENEATIGTFCDNILGSFNDVTNHIGTIFNDIGTIISDWWEKDGSGIFENVCASFNDVGTTFMNVFNEWIKPAWDAIVEVANSAWNDCLKPIFEKVVSVFGELADCIATVWNNFLSPIVNWLVTVLKPIFISVFNSIKNVFQTVFKIIGGVISGILKALGGIIDFITGVFSGNWKKAWKGIKDFFGGIWDAIWTVVKGVINLIIDGLNSLWGAVYGVVSGIVNGIGGIAGAIGNIFGQNWNFTMPAEPPLIPKLATGGIVKAPTLAMVGDNKNANVDPEVVSPLSKLQDIINTEKNSSAPDNQLIIMLSKITRLLENILDRVNSISISDKGDIVININGKEVFRVVRDENTKYKKSHGKSAFA